ncbi:hypothetical protein TRAPUB_4295 [Trametes pubescens]|uniref:Uncharacterized protein n=1 Tax=Trametes pubescens TaxID=154538 RepID=A0A1M2VBJ0_TRAPU|nr:hypothetical protein TRAPUB_4295 [Trametes pubescens]
MSSTPQTLAIPMPAHTSTPVSSLSFTQFLASTPSETPATPTPPQGGLIPQFLPFLAPQEDFASGVDRNVLTANSSFDTSSASFASQAGDLEPFVDLNKYRRLAEVHGLRNEQADSAVELASMTPHSARVVLYAQVQTGINLIHKLREQQNKVWVMPEKVQNRMHTLVRIALIAPLPFSWKNEFVRLIFKLLLKESMLPKDIENNSERKGLVDSKISRYASHVRSEMKTTIHTSLTSSPTDAIFELTKKLVQPCAANVEITKDVLASMAYLRKLVAKDVACQPAGLNGVSVSSRRDAWDVLDVRLKADYKQHEGDAARAKFLDEQLTNDVNLYGPSTGEIARSGTSLQTSIFEAARGGASMVSTAPRNTQ